MLGQDRERDYRVHSRTFCEFSGLDLDDFQLHTVTSVPSNPVRFSSWFSSQNVTVPTQTATVWLAHYRDC